MSESPVCDTISFSCTHCALELTVPLELAGVSGPCPGCSGTIQSPAPLVIPVVREAPVEVVSPQDRATREARKLPPQPRQMRSRPEPEPEPLDEPIGPLSQPLPAGRSGRRRSHGRSIHPVTGLSSRYDDERERGAIVRVSLAVLVTVVLVAVVYYFLKENI